MSSPKEPLGGMEKSIVTVVSRATFPSGSGQKRFIRDISRGHIQELTDKGRWFLAFIAHRYRRQYVLSVEQWQWVNERLNLKFANEDVRLKVGPAQTESTTYSLFYYSF